MPQPVLFGFSFPPTELFNDSSLFGGHTIMDSSLALNSPPGGKPTTNSLSHTQIVYANVDLQGPTFVSA